MRHPLGLAVVALALAGVLAGGAAPPHAHGDVPGLYNQEHDLTAFATLGSAAALLDSGDILVVAPVVSPAPGFAVTLAPAAAIRAAAPRAPPRA